MSLLETLKQDIRVKIPNPVERDEWRFTRYGLLTAAKEMTASPMSIVTSDLKEKAAVSEGLSLQIPVFKIGEVTVGNARTCNIGGLENTTEMVNVTWTTLTADISMKKAEHYVNEVNYLEDLNKKLLMVDHGFAKAVEQLVYTKLDTEKSQVHTSPIVAAEYTPVGNALQVSAAQEEYFFNNLAAIMEGDDFYSNPYKVLGSTTLKPAVNHYGNQGANNDENLQYQFDGYDFRFSNHVTIGAGKKSTGFCMTDGTLGIMTRINADARAGHKSTKGTEWSTTRLERFGFDVGVMYESECADLSATPHLAHLTASMVEKWQFSVDVALITPYNSDPATLAGVIKKFEIAP
jgi:hypothetical protein